MSLGAALLLGGISAGNTGPSHRQPHPGLLTSMLSPPDPAAEPGELARLREGEVLPLGSALLFPLQRRVVAVAWK